MSFQIWKRAATPPAAPGASGLPEVLPPALVSAAAARLAPLAVLVAAVTIVMGALDLSGLFGLPPTGRWSATWLLGAVASVGLSLSIAWIASREMLPPEKLLDLGLLYEVLEALFLAVTYHEVPPPRGIVPRGFTGVAVWVLAYPLIIPNSRRKTITATLLAAAMDPVGFLLAAAVAGRPVPAGAWPIFFTTAVAAGITIYVYRIVYRLSLAGGGNAEMGSYHLEKLLGRGGMGEVWLASHRLLARSAAVKLIRPDTLGSGGTEALKRFEREARATAALRSPHTIEVFDFGTTEGGTFYYVMELLEGLDAESLVRQHGPLPPERVVYLLKQACESLEEAHSKQLVHRDIKPQNIYVCRYGLQNDFVKVLDFGLVKGSGPLAGGRNLTASGTIAGTAEYIAPELARGDGKFDHRADLYSLGCVAYWLLTGRLVFEGETPVDILVEHLRTVPVPPSEKSGLPIPAPLEELVLSCLQKDPDHRPQSAREIFRRLDALRLEPSWTEERAEQWWRTAPSAPPVDLEATTEAPRRAPEAV